jgi:hypothetical protein
MEVESKLDVAKFELTDVVEVKTTADEGMVLVCRYPKYSRSHSSPLSLPIT